MLKRSLIIIATLSLLFVSNIFGQDKTSVPTPKRTVSKRVKGKVKKHRRKTTSRIRRPVRNLQTDDVNSDNESTVTGRKIRIKP
jgi:hypothetical protein